jgi:glutathione S-transferase
MLEIFHSRRSRSFRIVWLAEEMRLPYKIKSEILGNPSPECLAISPSGKLPAIRDGAVKMNESVAIMIYLTQKYGPTPIAPVLNDARYSDYLLFLVFGEASMAAILNPVLRTLFSAPEDQKQNFTINAAKEIFCLRIKDLAAQLEKAEYVAGDFSAADISVGWSLGLGAVLGLDAEYPRAVADYFARLKSRPAFQTAEVA